MTVANPGIPPGDIHPPGFRGFNLKPREFYSRLELFGDLVVECGPFVESYIRHQLIIQSVPAEFELLGLGAIITAMRDEIVNFIGKINKELVADRNFVILRPKFPAPDILRPMPLFY